MATAMATQHGPRSLDLEEKEKVREARAHILATKTHGDIILFSPVFPTFRYGPGSGHETSDDIIVFGPEPHVAKVRRDHPLLVDGQNPNGTLRPGLFRAHPEIEVVEDEAQRRYYACEVCEREFPAKGVLMHHRATAHANVQTQPDTEGRPLAKRPLTEKQARVLAKGRARAAEIRANRPKPQDEPPEDDDRDDGALDDDEPEADEGEPGD